MATHQDHSSTTTKAPHQSPISVSPLATDAQAPILRSPLDDTSADPHSAVFKSQELAHRSSGDGQGGKQDGKEESWKPKYGRTQSWDKQDWKRELQMSESPGVCPDPKVELQVELTVPGCGGSDDITTPDPLCLGPTLRTEKFILLRMESGTPMAQETAPLAPTPAPAKNYDNPIGPQVQPVQPIRPVDVDASPEDLPTDSHALAAAEPEEKGYAQTHSASSVKDLGWHNDSDSIPRPLIAGLPNDDLWVLLRRFNKQIQHVKTIPEPPMDNLDLNISPVEEFSPDKLRATIERLYMTIIVGSTNGVKHIARLRSWRERPRTMAFLAVYGVAWVYNLLVPTIAAFMMVLILVPSTRNIAFPPAPISLIDSSSGGVKTPAAGVLGSDDSLTGAPENHPGEAVEQEASNFVNAFSAIAISSAAGKGNQPPPSPSSTSAEGEGESTLDAVVPDPTEAPLKAADAQTKAAGGKAGAKGDKTKEPMSAAMWAKARPVMRAISDTTDTYERLANALSPTAPFPLLAPRLRLAAILSPLLIVSLFTSAHAVVKGTSFAIGFGFFGGPIIERGIEWLDAKNPDWQRMLRLRNSLLKGVPTNAQLTITLLRVGEKHNAPLPPPPEGQAALKDVPHETAGEDLEHLDASKSEIDAAVNPSAELEKEKAKAQKEEKEKPKKRGRHFVAFLRGTVRGGVETMLGADRLKAAAGAPHAKKRLGVVPSTPLPPAGPTSFPARYKGSRGCAVLNNDNASGPVLRWTKEGGSKEWSIDIGGIKEVKKVGGLGWGGKMVVGWATGREVADGMVITAAEGEFLLTAVGMRDELFNRVVAVGDHMWESW
ncbi:hypothetical protein V495_08421 [Pseudogymnoascus sp. VKM F-4514 (FW-929)]|nr:hypothetical protein V495_08421 [Pseudogymnoascus sp. VKM F-4514 (FW-929)]